jgi:hypothetical protein
MRHRIFKSATLFSSVLVLVLALAVLSGPALVARAAAADTTPVAATTAAQFCTGKTGNELAACDTGFNAGAPGNNHQKVNDACQPYQVKNPSNEQQIVLYDCQSAYAKAANEDPAAFCSIGSCDLIASYINPAIDLFSLSFGLIAVISLIIGGIQYSSSQGDPQKTAAAKNRIYKTMMAVFIYLFLFSFLQFLIPGGVFH